MSDIGPENPPRNTPGDIRRAFLAARRAGPPRQPLRPLPARELEAPIEVPDDGGESAPSLWAHGYVIASEVSSGGQATVYRALQESTGQTVAIKVLSGGSVADSRCRLRFEREAEVLASLSHPNVVGILDRGRTADGSLFLVMRYVRGPTLDGYLGAGTCDRASVHRVFEALCEAVGAAHARGVVHRDLKPANVRVDEWGHPHVLDFGLARLLGGPEGPGEPAPRRRDVAAADRVLGSLPWASPEQARGAAAVGSASDVYALGVMLYECLAGTPPYNVTGTVPEVIRAICSAEPEPPRPFDRGRPARPFGVGSEAGSVGSAGGTRWTPSS